MLIILKLDYMAIHNVLGRAGEEAVKDFFVCKGYTIREQNWRCGNLELDLVIERDCFVVFVEVKTRSNDVVDPALSITPKKIRNIINAGKGYLKMYNLPQLNMQIDIVTVVGEPGNFTITHYEDAVHPKLRGIR